MKRIAEPTAPPQPSSRADGAPPVREAAVAKRAPRAAASSPRAAGPSPSASGPRDVAILRAPPAPGGAAPIPTSAEMPLGYVVASGFFLAIAVVGFGLWLAFEVISL